MKRKKATHFSHKIITTETVNCQPVQEGNLVPSRREVGPTNQWVQNNNITLYH